MTNDMRMNSVQLLPMKNVSLLTAAEKPKPKVISPRNITQSKTLDLATGLKNTAAKASEEEEMISIKRSHESSHQPIFSRPVDAMRRKKVEER